ncbi:MAG: hypothetical protein AB7D96_10695 [Arcobacteraceae bacterium]
MKRVLIFCFAMAAALFMAGCSVVSTADKVYEKGVQAYELGVKVHDGLEKAGVGAKKAGELYWKVKGETTEDDNIPKLVE